MSAQFTLFWMYWCYFTALAAERLQKRSASDYPLIIITSLRICWWLFRKRLGELIDHNKINEMGQLRSPTQTSLWKCISFHSRFTFKNGNFKTNNLECQCEWAQSKCLKAQLGRGGDDRPRVIPAMWLCQGTKAETCQNMRPVFH